MEGEAAFAASDTNIAIVGDQTWVATGGRSSRVLYSSDKGMTWDVFETPIVQGLETTGMYSIDFYDALNGFAIGGDYTKPKSQHSNKIRTKDGGKLGKWWHRIKTRVIEVVCNMCLTATQWAWLPWVLRGSITVKTAVLLGSTLAMKAIIPFDF